MHQRDMHFISSPGYGPEAFEEGRLGFFFFFLDGISKCYASWL